MGNSKKVAQDIPGPERPRIFARYLSCNNLVSFKFFIMYLTYKILHKFFLFNVGRYRSKILVHGHSVVPNFSPPP